jgi:ammonium transporter, Amt family
MHKARVPFLLALVACCAAAMPSSAQSQAQTMEAFQSTPLIYPKFMIDNLWILVSSALVFVMHLGFATLETGLTRQKNTVNILFKNLFIISVGLIAYAFTGFNTMYPGDFNGVVQLGGPIGYAASEAVAHLTAAYADYTYWADFIFQAMFAATAATIVSGAVAERVKLNGFMLYAAILVAFCYPIAGSWKWGGGWLDQLGFYDFAGSSVVHAFGGFSALAAVLVLGPRLGKYSPDGHIRPVLGHSMPLATIGVFLLWLGWFGFNGGSVLSADPTLVSLVFVTTALAAAAGCLAAIVTSSAYLQKPDVTMALNGILAGLVGITASADTVSWISSVIIGAIAGVIVVFAIVRIDHAGLDDPVGAISVHGVCGVWGTLAVGLFSTNPDHSLGIQALGTASYALFAFTISAVLLLLIRLTIGIRVDPEEEEEGLDLGEHGQPAYADFQHLNN